MTGKLEIRFDKYYRFAPKCDTLQMGRGGRRRKIDFSRQIRAIRDIIAAAIWLLGFTPVALARPIDATITIHIPSGPVRTFTPDRALGAALDGYQQGDVDRIYTKPNIALMRSAGFKFTSYRLRTELGIEAWHWSPTGAWSDPAHHCGYWTSTTPIAPIMTSYGYALPRRGDTYDQANNAGYSRIDDGDLATFWKSNPYLCRPFAAEGRPQWIVVGLPKTVPVSRLRIAWADPYAVQYRVEYWDGPTPSRTGLDDTFYGAGLWTPFPKGAIDHGTGGTSDLTLADTPIATRFVRIVLITGSNTTATKSNDIRDRLGFAVREIWLGNTGPNGRLVDLLKHGRDINHQSVIYVSSTDPWHRATDIDRDTEQPGFDRFFRCGITNAGDVMIPCGLLYDTPDNAVAELQFMRQRGYKVHQIELGEEPDGQCVAPEDYAELYIELADRLRKIDPKVAIGGPSFQTMALPEAAWPDSTNNRSWPGRFIGYLKERRALGDLGFFSSECYLFDNVCEPPATHLMMVPVIVDQAIARWRAAGVPENIPWIITEYGYSAYATAAEVDLPGAIFDADVTAKLLSDGVSTVCYYGIEPNVLMNEATTCETWGNLALWLTDNDGHLTARTAALVGLSLLARQWIEPGLLPNQIFTADANCRSRFGDEKISGYALHRPDGRWSLLLLNKDPQVSYRVRITADRQPPTSSASKAVEPSFGAGAVVYQYSKSQYVWHLRGETSYASPNLPPVHYVASSDKFVLPPFSITVVRSRE